MLNARTTIFVTVDAPIIENPKEALIENFIGDDNHCFFYSYLLIIQQMC